MSQILTGDCLTEAPAITAIAPWFGAKRNLASSIIAELGTHRSYWEPFCGSMAVLLGKTPCSMETVNDLHGDLINLARVLANEDTAVELYGHLARTLMHEDVFTECAEQWRLTLRTPAPEKADTARAYRWFVVSWMGRNGVAGTDSYNACYCVRYTKNGGHAATRFKACVESIPAWHERLRSVMILNRDGIELLERIEDATGTAIYADPPYLVKDAAYVHDFDGIAHHHLATALRRFTKTRVVVSYYDHPKLAALYPGWQKKLIYTTKAMSSAQMRDKSGTNVAPEVLLINGPLFTA